MHTIKYELFIFTVQLLTNTEIIIQQISNSLILYLYTQFPVLWYS